MTVALDGAPYEPEPSAPPWQRGDFARLLDDITAQRRVPVRVEVREVDGATFTDIITPGRRRRAVSEANEPGRTPGPALAVLSGGGFEPGEDVAIAIVIAKATAAADGTTRGLLTAHQLSLSPTREAVLLGRISGTATIGHAE